MGQNHTHRNTFLVSVLCDKLRRKHSGHQNKLIVQIDKVEMEWNML